MTEFFGQEIQIVQVGVPVGTMVEYAGDTAPNDWMLCQGQALKISLYPALNGVIGVKYGSGDGSGSEFNLPDCQNRVTVGKSATKPLGANAGVETVALTTAQIPSHSHGGSVSTVGNHSHGGGTGAAGGHSHNSAVNVIGFQQPPFGSMGIMRDIENAAIGINGYRASIVQGVGDHAHAIGADGGHGHTITAEGGGTAHDNMPPYVVVNKIIKVV